VEGFEEEKKQMGSIEAKMNQIGSGIEDILRESGELTRTNEELERKLCERDKIIETLKREASRSTENIDSYQQKIDEYEKLRLKNAKRSRDMLELMDEADR
jgi:methyl-accepting chemotaxis protein